MFAPQVVVSFSLLKRLKRGETVSSDFSGNPEAQRRKGRKETGRVGNFEYEATEKTVARWSGVCPPVVRGLTGSYPPCVRALFGLCPGFIRGLSACLVLVIRGLRTFNAEGQKNLEQKKETKNEWGGGGDQRNRSFRFRNRSNRRNSVSFGFLWA